MFLVGYVCADGFFVKRNSVDDVPVRTDPCDCLKFICMLFIIGIQQFFALRG